MRARVSEGRSGGILWLDYEKLLTNKSLERAYFVDSRMGSRCSNRRAGCVRILKATRRTMSHIGSRMERLCMAQMFCAPVGVLWVETMIYSSNGTKHTDLTFNDRILRGKVPARYVKGNGLTRSCELSIRSIFFRRSHEHPTIPSPSKSRDPVPSSYYWKSKRRKDMHLTKNLRNDGESHYLLPGTWSEESEGTWSNLFVCQPA